MSAVGLGLVLLAEPSICTNAILTLLAPDTWEAARHYHIRSRPAGSEPDVVYVDPIRAGFPRVIVILEGYVVERRFVHLHAVGILHALYVKFEARVQSFVIAAVIDRERTEVIFLARLADFTVGCSEHRFVGIVGIGSYSAVKNLHAAHAVCRVACGVRLL